MVRSAVLAGFPTLAAMLGIASDQSLAKAGIDPDLLQCPDCRVPLGQVARLLDEACKASGRSDVGLLLSQSVNLERLGLLGLLASGRPTVAAAAQAIMGFVQLHNEALHLWIDRSGGQLILREEYLTGPAIATDQLVKLSAGVITGNLRAMIADKWKPLRASFRHARPADTSAYARIFGCPVDFDADFDGLTIAAHDFSLPNRLRGADPTDYLQRVRQQIDGKPSAITLRLATHLIWSLLPAGDCTAVRIAGLLDYDRRTLHRHLIDQGQTFSSLLNAIRRELATRHVGLGSRTLGDIAQLLGFRSQSDFSHWFRREFDTPPSYWRQT